MTTWFALPPDITMNRDRLCPAPAPRSRWRAAALMLLMALACVALLFTGHAFAQDMNSGGDMTIPPVGGATALNPSEPPPMTQMHMMQPISGSMMVSPPYGTAPLKVGFFVLANDPEGLGFLTYSWNFGDGTVSSLPPELYIFHTYQKPGTYVCSLTAKTVDGRSVIFIQGVIVQPSA